MKKPARLKPIALLLLGIGTFFAARGIVAEPPEERPAPFLKSSPARVLAPGERSRPAGQIDRRFDAICSIGKIGCSSAGGTVRVAADATVFDKRSGARYVWTLRLFDPSDERLEAPLFEKIYEDQVFAPAQLQARPTFADVIEPALPAGDYVAELALSLVNPQTGLEAVRDPARSQRQIRSAKRRHITIE